MRAVRGQSTELLQGGRSDYVGSELEELTLDVMRVQSKARARSCSRKLKRACFSKQHFAVANAIFRISKKIPKRFQQGYFAPGAAYRTTLRFSTASGAAHSKSIGDLHGLAIRIGVSADEYHDLLMVNFPVSLARDARQLVALLRAATGSKVLFLPRLLLSDGMFDAWRLIRTLREVDRRQVRSLALETYWSQTPIRWGTLGPVQYRLTPSDGALEAPKVPSKDPDYLRREIGDQLRQRSIDFDFCVQRYVNDSSTPIDDALVKWSDEASPPVKLATLSIPQQDTYSTEATTSEHQIENISFNPWITTTDFEPLGSLNQERKAIYAASAAHRLGYRFLDKVPLQNRLLRRPILFAFKCLNRMWPWHRLPWRLGLLNLAVIREELWRRNLFEVDGHEATPNTEPIPKTVPEWARTCRSFDGSYNDLSDAAMGSVGCTFGRNMKPAIPSKYAFDDPNPIDVSQQLLQREAFIPAKSLNLLAAAWIQFQVHDWVNHPRYELGKKHVSIPLPPGRKWRNRRDGPEEKHMRIAENICEMRQGCPVFVNSATSWWDSSELYGCDGGKAAELRSGPFLVLEGGYLPVNADGLQLTGFNESWWLGLSLMHTLFAREHNSICEALKFTYPSWNDECVYQTARLIVSALIAKIHTVEWTPAILANKAVEVGVRSNWFGPPRSLRTRLGLWLFDAHSLKSIRLTQPNHHGVPYAMTEEFVSVYRMHPLIPDDYCFLDHRNDELIETKSFSEVAGPLASSALRRLQLTNALYSFGVAHPGAITLRNFPRGLQRFERHNGEIIDLSVVDILRDRTRCIPRYNDFRTALHKPKLRSFKELSADPEIVERLSSVYTDIDQVDTMVGLFAEAPPEGFGFSDTAFRIFALMASRRLQSDRFFTVDFRPEIYSPLGLDWVDKNTMTSVILRHCPELRATIPSGASAFEPWRRVGSLSI
jgi:hypothetical protein